VRPQFGHYGRSPRTDAFRLPGVWNFDFSANKSFRFRETRSVEFRAEVFNLLGGTRGGSGGTSSARVYIGTDGLAHDIHVIEGLGYGLDDSAVHCVRRWRFHPGSTGGVPIAVPATIEMFFELDYFTSPTPTQV
jgi:hypothetical protein